MQVPYLTEDIVKRHLNWDTLVPTMERALSDNSKKDKVIQPPRLILFIPPKNGALLSMPAYSHSENSLGCKMVTSFKGNKERGIPSIMGTVMLFDGDTGKLKAIVEASELTGWRTAAASVVATKYMHKGKKEVLAILGAGVQGRTHAMALKHFYNFKEVRIWNRNSEKARKLCSELGSPQIYKPYSSNESCVRGADVICTTTYASEPILKNNWLKEGAHINAIGAGLTHHSEVDVETYRKATIVVDSMDAARTELKGLFDMKAKIVGEIGEIINNKPFNSTGVPVTIYHSLGIAIEDVMAANLIYSSY